MKFDQDRFQQLRESQGVTWGRPVRVLRRTTSTNDLALEAVRSDARTGIVWLAFEQTKGRGRRGNRWLAPPGEALLMSTLLRWPGPRVTPGVALAAGWATRQICQEILPHQQVLLKWPNDVLAADRKIAGILVESRHDDRGQPGLAVGIGLNLTTRHFEAAAGQAGSLQLLGARQEDLQLESVLVGLLRHLENSLGLFISKGLPALLPNISQCDALFGRELRIHNEAGVLRGTARGISAHGHLMLEVDGRLRQIDSGHVETLSTSERAPP